MFPIIKDSRHLGNFLSFQSAVPVQPVWLFLHLKGEHVFIMEGFMNAVMVYAEKKDLQMCPSVLNDQER